MAVLCLGGLFSYSVAFRIIAQTRPAELYINFKFKYCHSWRAFESEPIRKLFQRLDYCSLQTLQIGIVKLGPNSAVLDAVQRDFVLSRCSSQAGRAGFTSLKESTALSASFTKLAL